MHPSHFSQDEYFNRYLHQLGVAPTAANKVRKGFSTHHVVSLDPLVAKAQMMKFKPLDDCEVHGVWVGLPAFAASRRPSHQTSGICAYHQARNSKLVVSEEFAICGMFIQVGHAKMQRDELGQIRVGSLYDHSCGMSFGKWCLNLYSVEAPMKSMKDVTVIGTL